MIDWMRRRRNLAAFGADRSGSVATVFGLSLTVLLVFVGAGLDMGRWYLARRITLDALDAAVLAGGHAMQTNPDDIQGAMDAAMKYYLANTVSRAAVDSDTVQFVVADNNQAVTATGSAYYATSFIRLAGFTRMALVTDAAAAFPIATRGTGGGKIEISLMLDVTGSFCNDGIGPCRSSTKLDGLKTAAQDLVNIVTSANATPDGSRVALVPFASRIRLGPDSAGGPLMKKVTNLDPMWTGWVTECTSATGSYGGEGPDTYQCLATTVQNISWPIMPCVTDRVVGTTFDATDDAPGPDKWTNAHDGSRMAVSWDSSDSNVPTSGLGVTQADPAGFWNYSTGGCYDMAPGNDVQPLTSDKTVLHNRIAGLEAVGSTAGALGTAWAWYMLSPKWNQIWTGVNAPDPYEDLALKVPSGAAKLRKVAVLLTDGGYNTFRGAKGQDQQTVSNYAIQICDGMKAKGIEVYTIGFGLDLLSASERAISTATLQACGTDVSHFYNSLDVMQLQSSFRDIALKLSTLRLTH